MTDAPRPRWICGLHDIRELAAQPPQESTKLWRLFGTDEAATITLMPIGEHPVPTLSRFDKIGWAITTERKCTLSDAEISDGPKRFADISFTTGALDNDVALTSVIAAELTVGGIWTQICTFIASAVGRTTHLANSPQRIAVADVARVVNEELRSRSILIDIRDIVFSLGRILSPTIPEIAINRFVRPD